MLLISETLCNRFNLDRYSVGEKSPRPAINERFFSGKNNKSNTIFYQEELELLGIALDDLSPFILDRNSIEHIEDETVDNSSLQKFPLLPQQDSITVALPTAISYAIRHMIIDVLSKGFSKATNNAIIREYIELFERQNLFGSFPLKIESFSKNDWKTYESCVCVEDGLYMHVILNFDSLADIKETGIAGFQPENDRYIKIIAERIQIAFEHTKKLPGFCKGVSIIIDCGVGRGTGFHLPEIDDRIWKVEFMSAPDIITLSNIKGFSAIKFLRILETVEKLKNSGLAILNLGGWVNLIACVYENNGSVVPHSALPRGARSGSPDMYTITTDFMINLRSQVAQQNDVHGVEYMDGSIVRVRKNNGFLFSKDITAPLYFEDTIWPKRRILSVYKSSTNRNWWCRLLLPKSEGFLRKRLINTWVVRIIPFLEPYVDQQLRQAVELRVEFEDSLYQHETQDRQVNRETIRESISIEVSHESNAISLKFGRDFDIGSRDSKNTSERELVRAVCKGFGMLAKTELHESTLDDLESEIVQDDNARIMHVFPVNNYRDRIQHQDLPNVVALDEIDLAELKIGMAFLAEPQANGRVKLRSKKQCTQLLNNLVLQLEKELCDCLKTFNREALLTKCMENHEAAQVEKSHLHRTVPSAYALNGVDVNNTFEVIANLDSKVSGAIAQSRILFELAICECPTKGGLIPNTLDMLNLMAKLHAIMTFGGWSDAIYYEAMPPDLSITLFGDVQSNNQFEENVLRPFLHRHISSQIASSKENYESLYDVKEKNIDVDAIFDAKFEYAWEQEFGVSLKDILHFVRSLIELGIDKQSYFYGIKYHEMIDFLNRNSCVKNQEAIIELFSFKSRDKWLVPPDGYTEKDIQPWRFRRKLSVLRKPMLRYDDNNLLVAPGFMQECILYTIRGFHQSTFTRDQCKTKAMKDWLVHVNEQQSKMHVSDVVNKCISYGWKTKQEIHVREILKRRVDAKYGDVNVFGDVDILAWNKKTAKIFVIECKYLQFKKTHGEIAEQLSDYRGRTKHNGKADDLLKHIRRLEILRHYKSELCSLLKMPDDANIEGWIIFANPVPMIYAWEKYSHLMNIISLDNIDSIFIGSSIE